MSQVKPWLLVGDKALARNRVKLQALRVRYVLNCVRQKGSILLPVACMAPCPTLARSE